MHGNRLVEKFFKGLFELKIVKFVGLSLGHTEIVNEAKVFEAELTKMATWEEFLSGDTGAIDEGFRQEEYSRGLWPLITVSWNLFTSQYFV